MNSNPLNFLYLCAIVTFELMPVVCEIFLMLFSPPFFLFILDKRNKGCGMLLSYSFCTFIYNTFFILYITKLILSYKSFLQCCSFDCNVSDITCLTHLNRSVWIFSVSNCFMQHFHRSLEALLDSLETQDKK